MSVSRCTAFSRNRSKAHGSHQRHGRRTTRHSPKKGITLKLEGAGRANESRERLGVFWVFAVLRTFGVAGEPHRRPCPEPSTCVPPAGRILLLMLYSLRALNEPTSGIACPPLLGCPLKPSENIPEYDPPEKYGKHKMFQGATEPTISNMRLLL